MSANILEELIPELGDQIKIVGKTGEIQGIIVYRSDRMIRIRPFSSKTTIYEFPLDADGAYMPELGVTETYIDPDKKARDPHFSVQMEVRPGSEVEFYDRDGVPIRKTVYEVIATDTHDGLKFTDGEVMDFQFIGLPDPYVTYLDVTNEDMENIVLPDAKAVLEAPEEAPKAPVVEFEDDLISKLLEQQESIVQDETAQINRPYPEDQQRQDMFISVMQMIAPKAEQQKNPRILRKAYIQTDILAALKRSVVELNSQGQPLLNTSKSLIVDTAQNLLDHTLPTILLPIVEVRKVLTTTNTELEDETVEYAGEAQTNEKTKEIFDTFNKSINAPRRTENAFETYIRGMNETLNAYAIHPTPSFEVKKDVEVYVGIPGETVLGFEKLSEKKEEVVIEDVSNVPAYITRLASERGVFFDRIANKTLLLQTADTGKKAGYILLSPELAYTRISEQSSVLLWDIHASEWSRNRTKTLKQRLFEAKNNQIFNADEQISIPIRDILRNRLQPSLSLNSWANACIMDSIGLRALELTREQMYEFHVKLIEGQTQWDIAMAKMKEDTLSYLSKDSTFPVKPIVNMDDSLLYSEAILTDPVMAKFMESYNNKETLLQRYDIALMNAFMNTPYDTLLPYWSALVSRTSQELIQSTQQSYVTETDRQRRKQETQRELMRRFTAAPIINKCPHVRDYEILNKISNDGERMKALESFVRTYNGGMQNNFVKCNKCLQNLVCKHELLLIQEYKIQDQSTAIHKQLVLEFGGPVFMGVYVCKNCGQKISNLEFDTHLEFDDEGRPLVGRSVIVPDEAETAEDVSRAEHDVKIAYITESSRDLQRDFVLYQNLKRVFEEAHIVLDDNLAKTLLDELKLFLGTLAPKEKYNLARKQIKTLPEYEIFYNQNLIGALGALAVIELQNLPTDIALPNRQCPYSRSGFPIDYLDGVKTDPVDLGAVRYIICVLGLIQSNQAPWNAVLWADLSKKPEERSKMIQSSVISALAGMRGVDTTLKVAKIPIPRLTDAQTKRMRAALLARTTAVQVRIETENGVKVEMKPSDADRLPSHFHPCPHYVQTQASEAIEIGNAERFSTNVESLAIPDIKPIVASRMSQIHQDIMYQMNRDADTSLAGRTFKMEDVGNIGLGYNSAQLNTNLSAEYKLITKSFQALDRRDPSRPNTGTHIYVPWMAPESDIVEPTPDETIYYKLFSKVCAIGENKGSVHEFTYGNVCRYCRFVMDDALIYETMSEIPVSARDINDRLAAQAERRKAAVETACYAIGVDINEATFNELRAAINTHKRVLARMITPEMNSIERIQSLEPYIPDGAKETLAALVSGMSIILGDGTKAPLYGNARYRPLHDFYRRVDEIKAQFTTLLVDSLPFVGARQDQRLKRVTEKLDVYEQILGNISGDECIRSARRMFVFNSRFIRENYRAPDFPLKRWIPNIYKGHQADFNKRVSSLEGYVNESYTLFEETFDKEESELRNTILSVLNAITSKIGQFLRHWQTYIRPNQVFVVQETINEYTTVLRWAIYSILYSEFPKDSDDRVKQFISEWILNTIQSEYVNYATYRKTPEEIKSSMNDRREREKAHKIKKQDDEKDPEIRKLMRTALKLGYGEDAILRKSGYNADAESVRFAELQALGITADRDERGPAPANQDEGMGDIRDEDGGDI